MTGSAIQQEIPGLKEVHAVDAAGVHPLLLAIGSERYTPYTPTQQPAEILTIANHMLGTGQLSLAKFLFITADDKNSITTKNIKEYLAFIFERIHLERDIHFYTNTTIDTLDYSGEGLNTGSKVVIAAYGKPIRKLSNEPHSKFQQLQHFENCKLVMPGVVALQTRSFTSYINAADEMNQLDEQLKGIEKDWSKCEGISEEIVMIIICDDSNFIAAELNNFLWVTFTRCNPSHDIYGINASIKNKHWGCKGPLVIDARKKPHHAPAVEKDPETENKIQKYFEKGGSLYGVI